MGSSSPLDVRWILKVIQDIGQRTHNSSIDEDINMIDQSCGTVVSINVINIYSQADLFTEHQCGRLLPAHRSQLDVMSLIFGQNG